MGSDLHVFVPASLVQFAFWTETFARTIAKTEKHGHFLTGTELLPKFDHVHNATNME
jgi:hypothetical protein